MDSISDATQQKNLRNTWLFAHSDSINNVIIYDLLENINQQEMNKNTMR